MKIDKLKYTLVDVILQETPNSLEYSDSRNILRVLA